MPIIVRSRSPYLLYNLSRAGPSARHGAHQVVQKSRSTVFPLKEDSASGLPSISVAVKSGAGLPANCFLILAAFQDDSSFTSLISLEGSLKRLSSAAAP